MTALLTILGLAGCAANKAPAPAAAPTAEPSTVEVAPAATLERRDFAPARAGEPVRDGIAYGPHREGQSPGGAQPTREQMAEDLAIIAQHWGMLRMYGSRGVTGTVLDIIEEQSLPLGVVVGAWIDVDDPVANQAEVDEAIALAQAHPDTVIAVAIGNETQVSWAAHRSALGPVIDHVRATRAAVSQPVTSADDYSYWVLPESRALADELDFLLVHAHPQWNGQQLDEAMAWTEATLADVQAMHPDHQLVIGEIGWSTDMNPEGREAELVRAPAGVPEQAAFYQDFLAWAEPRPIRWFWFEAFDEPWKGSDHPREIEKHWGLYGVDRVPKTPPGENANEH